MRNTTVTISGVAHYLRQSHIDQRVWPVVPGTPTPQGVVSRNDTTPAVGWVVVYVDDFLIVGPDSTINAATAVISNK